MNPPPNCPKCNSNSQVWVNQLSGKLTCHRAFCHTEIIEPLSPEQEAFAAGLEELGAKKQGIRHVALLSVPAEDTNTIRPLVYKRKTPSLLARLFTGIGAKARGWSRRSHD